MVLEIKSVIYPWNKQVNLRRQYAIVLIGENMLKTVSKDW